MELRAIAPHPAAAGFLPNPASPRRVPSFKALRQRRRAEWLDACQRVRRANRLLDGTMVDKGTSIDSESVELDARARHARDLAYVKQVLAGDLAALELLPARLECLPAVVRYQNKKLGTPLNETEIEETVRETVVALWAKLPSFEGRSTLETWVCRFAFLEVLKSVQRKCRTPEPLSDSVANAIAEPERDEPQRERFDAADLAQALQSLTRDAAEVVRLRHFEQLSFEAIAARAGTGLNTVKARYYRGLARLKEILERKQRREDA